LHKRSGFNDSQDGKRLMYRARYYDRVDDSGLNPQDRMNGGNQG